LEFGEENRFSGADPAETILANFENRPGWVLQLPQIELMDCTIAFLSLS
jgi:hypothetical protein